MLCLYWFGHTLRPLKLIGGGRDSKSKVISPSFLGEAKVKNIQLRKNVFYLNVFTMLVDLGCI